MLSLLSLLLLCSLLSTAAPLSLGVSRRALLSSPLLLASDPAPPPPPSLPRLTAIILPTYNPSTHASCVSLLSSAFPSISLLSSTPSSATFAFGPSDAPDPSFLPGVSSPSLDGGHARLTLRHDPDRPLPAPALDAESPPQTALAYVQIAVPSFRASQIVKFGGEVLSSYGYVNALLPSGQQLRVVVGDSPDPLPYVALRPATAAAFERARASLPERYALVPSPPPLFRPPASDPSFSPPPPPSSAYLSGLLPAGSPGGFGVLLLPPGYRGDGSDEGRGRFALPRGRRGVGRSDARLEWGGGEEAIEDALK